MHIWTPNWSNWVILILIGIHILLRGPIDDLILTHDLILVLILILILILKNIARIPHDIDIVLDLKWSFFLSL